MGPTSELEWRLGITQRNWTRIRKRHEGQVQEGQISRKRRKTLVRREGGGGQAGEDPVWGHHLADGILGHLSKEMAEAVDSLINAAAAGVEPVDTRARPIAAACGEEGGGYNNSVQDDKFQKSGFVGSLNRAKLWMNGSGYRCWEAAEA